MSETLTDKHHDWVKTFLGIDTRPQAAQDASAGAGKPAGNAPAGAGQAGKAASPPGGVFDKLGKLAHGVADGIGHAAKAVKDEAVKVGHAVEDTAKKVEHAVVDTAKKVEHGVVDTAKKVVHAVEDTAAKVADGVTDVITGAEGKLYDAAMKELDTEIKHVKDAGLDASHYAAQAKDIRAEYAKAVKLAGRTDRIAAVTKLTLQAREAASDAKTDVARVTKEAVKGVGTAITDMRDGAKKQIDKLPKDSKDKPGLEKRLAALDAAIAAAGKVTDPAQHAKQLKQVNTTAEKLFDDAAAASGDKAAVQAVYSKAIKDRYGIDITNASSVKNTHFDDMYKMFDKVPDTDVVQGKLKKLNYNKSNPSANYGSAQIEFGDYPDGAILVYKDPVTGKEAEKNAFSITTLHELGHSVDDRFGIMSGNSGKAGSGGWQKESLQSVARAYAGEFRSGKGNAVKIDDKELNGLIEDALSGKVPKRPGKMSEADWKMLQGTLNDCSKRGVKNNPWETPHDIGGRCYHEAYAGTWLSFAKASHDKKIWVSKYQWRAPGEFFAELYAYTFFHSQQPPNGVDPTIAQYMYGGKAASDSAPPAKH